MRPTRKPPPIPLHKKISYVLETIVVYLLYGFFSLLPLQQASRFGGWMIRKIGPHSRSHKIAEKNLSIAFPDIDENEKQEILKGMWDNLGRVMAEYPHLHRIWDNVELIGGANLEAVRDSGKPAIFVSAHLANWELCPIAAKKAGLPISLVYRKPNNPWVDGLLRRAREAGATSHIEKGWRGARQIVDCLRNNEAVGILNDQKLNEGLAIPFFGVAAMTAPAIAQFALKFDCPIYPAVTQRLDGHNFRLTVYPPIDIIRTENTDADVEKILTDINIIIETWIRKSPEQWLWIHKRWPEEVY